jgi:hypothetical protein
LGDLSSSTRIEVDRLHSRRLRAEHRALTPMNALRASAAAAGRALPAELAEDSFGSVRSECDSPESIRREDSCDSRYGDREDSTASNPPSAAWRSPKASAAAGRIIQVMPTSPGAGVGVGGTARGGGEHPAARADDDDEVDLPGIVGHVLDKLGIGASFAGAGTSAATATPAGAPGTPAAGPGAPAASAEGGSARHRPPPSVEAVQAAELWTNGPPRRPPSPQSPAPRSPHIRPSSPHVRASKVSWGRPGGD